MIGIINYLGMDLSKPYWANHFLQLHKWYYHLLRHSLIYTIGIINTLGTYFPNIVDSDTSLTRLVFPFPLSFTEAYTFTKKSKLSVSLSQHPHYIPGTKINMVIQNILCT